MKIMYKAFKILSPTLIFEGNLVVRKTGCAPLCSCVLFIIRCILKSEFYPFSSLCDLMAAAVFLIFFYQSHS